MKDNNIFFIKIQTKMLHGCPVSVLTFHKTVDPDVTFQITDSFVSHFDEVFNCLKRAHLIIDGNSIAGKPGKIIIHCNKRIGKLLKKSNIFILHFCGKDNGPLTVQGIQIRKLRGQFPTFVYRAENDIVTKRTGMVFYIFH